jgi:hypothetical protein
MVRKCSKIRYKFVDETFLKNCGTLEFEQKIWKKIQIWVKKI